MHPFLVHLRVQVWEVVRKVSIDLLPDWSIRQVTLVGEEKIVTVGKDLILLTQTIVHLICAQLVVYVILLSLPDTFKACVLLLHYK